MWNDLSLDDEAPEAGCSWPVIETCEPVAGLDPAIAEWAQQMAIEILWAASGRQFGVCAATYRPCARSCDRGLEAIDAWDLVGRHSLFQWDPWAGSIFATIACGCGESCSCGPLEAISLWHKRVRQVTEVVIDGIVLDPTSYRLSKNRLIRTDGQRWPSCQDWTVAAGEPGSWSVSYVHGTPVPYGGRVSAGILSNELGKAVCGDETCELPRRVQTVSRAGVTIGFVDPMTFLEQGRTGLYEVDLWLVSVNPNRLARRARVHRVDDPRRLARGRMR